MIKGCVGTPSRISIYPVWLIPCLVTICFSLLFQFPVRSQQLFQLENSRKKISIPFDLHRNLVIIPVFLNNQGPFNFILDTGVGMALITNPALLDSLNLSKGSEVRIVGAGGSQEGILAYLIPTLQVKGPGFLAPNITMTILSKDIFDLSSYVGIPIAGILGYQFFNSFVVRINFIDSKLTLYQPATYKYKKRDGQKIPFDIVELKPYIETITTFSDNSQIQTRLIVDTGAGHALSLEQNAGKAIPVPDPAFRTRLGTGLSGSINGYLGRVKRFQVNKFVFNQVLTSFPDFEDVGAKVTYLDRNGNLGTEVLRRFHFIFDYSRNTLILKPNHNYREAFNHDMFGVEVIATGDEYQRLIINSVEPGSPAHEADIQPLDEILFINGFPAKELTITKIDRLFKTRDGFHILMGLRRGSKTIFRYAKLKKRI